jgi:hypothetical protein
MIILPTIRYGDVAVAYGSASPTTLKTLDLVHHEAVRLALGTFAVCRTENVLHEAGISTLAEIREQDTARMAIRVITNESHPIRSYFMNNQTKNNQTHIHKAIEYLGQLCIDVRRIESTPYYIRPPWTGADWNQKASAMDQKTPATFHKKNQVAQKIPSKGLFLDLLYNYQSERKIKHFYFV